MAMIGINPTPQYQGRKGTLERIALGVDIATKLLGAGVGAYKTFAADIPQAEAATQQAKAQTQYLQADTAYKQNTLAMQLLQMGYRPSDLYSTLNANGYMPVNKDQIHIPDLSTGPNSHEMSSNGVTVKTNPAAPNMLDVNGKTWAQVSNPTVLDEEQKMRMQGEMENGNYHLTGADDPHAVPFNLPRAPYAFYKAPSQLPQEKQVSLSQEAMKNFEGNDDVARFNNVNQSAQFAYNYAKNMADGLAPNPSQDTGLAQSFLNALSKTNRGPNAGNIEDTLTQAEALIPGVAAKIRGALSGGVAKIDPTTRTNMIGAIGSVYQSMRPLYDSAYQTYAGQAQASGLSVQPAKPIIDFSQLNLNRPARPIPISSPSPGGLAGQISQPPQPNPGQSLDNALNFFGGQ